jgi:hypothetical protein
MTPTKSLLSLAAALIATCALSACNQAKSPDQVAKDTAAAEASANDHTAKVEEKAGEKLTSAQAVVQDEQQSADHTKAVQTEKVLTAQADGEHKVALAKCESMSGESQKACNAQADAAYQVAQDEAKQVKANSDPKP